MNRREWVLYGQKELEEAQIENASGDAWYLFSECFHISREDYLFGMTDEINDKEAEERYKELIQKRKEHVPLQYILGTQEFMGYTFKVTPDVLIPRADTETVLEEVLDQLKQSKKPDTILDICTGSGCIAISLALILNPEVCIGTDISEKALKIAKANGENLAPMVKFIQSDLFENVTGSYDLIMPKFEKFAESRNQDKYYVRGTFTHHNLDFSQDVLHLADLGFKQISVEPVVAADTEEYAIREEDIPQILEQYDILAKEMIKREKEGKGFNFFHFMIDLTGGPCVYKRLSGCGSGTEYLAVTPWGDFYPCHQFVGEEQYLMGNVDEGITKPEIVKDFGRCNVYTKPDCKDCFARFYCSGGCAANGYHFGGDIRGNYKIGCELQRKRVECAIMIKAALAE